jgi:tetratricopeptide (TPR) repeat protein
MKLHAREPDSRDRVQLLLELLRQDAKSLVIETLVPVLRPVVRDHPDDIHSSIALAKALIRTSQQDEGLSTLRLLLKQVPEHPLVWDACLSGLDEAFRYEELETALGELPGPLSSDSRFLKYRAALLQSQHRWAEAADCYRKALETDPADGPLIYRLCQTLRASGRLEEAERLEPRRKAVEAAREGALRLYEEANATADLGTRPHPDLYRRLAELREQMGRPEEALAWHQLVLRDDPSDSRSKAAVERLALRVSGPNPTGFVPR